MKKSKVGRKFKKAKADVLSKEERNQILELWEWHKKERAEIHQARKDLDERSNRANSTNKKALAEKYNVDESVIESVIYIGHRP